MTETKLALICLVVLSAVVTVACLWPSHADKVILIYLTIICWWSLFLTIRVQVLSSVRDQILHSQSELSEGLKLLKALPEFTVMIASPRFYHMWTFNAWLVYAQARVHGLSSKG